MEKTTQILWYQLSLAHFCLIQKMQPNMEGFSSRPPTKPPVSEDRTHKK